MGVTAILSTRLCRGLKAHADRTLEFPLLGEGPQRAQVPGRIRKRFPVCLGPNRKCDFFRISPGEIESALDEGFGRHARLLCSHTTVWRDRRLHARFGHWQRPASLIQSV